MAWIESHQEIWRHPKTKKLARLLKISVPTAVGYLHGLWYWAMDFAQDGDISKYDPEDIADAVLWDDPADMLLNAFVEAGFVDRDDQTITIHDWLDYAGNLIARKEIQKEQTRERVKRYRNRRNKEGNADVTPCNADVTPCNAPTVPNQTVPNQTVPDVPPIAPQGAAPSQSGESLTVKTAGMAAGNETREQPSKTLTDRRFDEFWATYPRKVGKQAALNAFRKIKPNEELFGRIIKAVNDAKSAEQWQRDSGRYIPNPATWLNQGRWDDELPQGPTQAPKGKPKALNYRQRTYEDGELDHLFASFDNDDDQEGV